MDIRDWFYRVYLPLIENPELLNKSLHQGELRSFSHGGFDVVGSFGSRVTFRFFSATVETIEQAPPFLPLIYYSRPFGIMDSKSGPYKGEYTLTMKGFLETLKKPDWKYSEPVNDKTSYSAGGYLLFFEKGNKSETNQMLEEWIYNNSIFNTMVGLVNFDTILYEDFYDHYVYCKHLFRMTPSGNVIAETSISVIIIT